MAIEHSRNTSLAFAKLTATPTEKAWSQAYNAGNLFACLSLNSKGEEDLHALQALGKELFSNLEAEFFTLEEKTLETIRDAIQKSLSHIPETVFADFSLAYFKDTVLYLFVSGESLVLMKRGGKLGTLLAGRRDAEQKIQTASGYLQNEDVIILETNQFASNISDQHLLESLELSLPNDIAESLSVHMHEKTDGDQAAIIIAYHGIAKPALDKPYEEDENITLADIQTEEEPQPQRPHLPNFSFLSKFLPRSGIPLRGTPLPSLPYLNHRKKFFLSISVIILALLIVSVFLTKQKQTNSKNAEIFNSIYPPAQKAYDEGVGLKTLNASLSREDLLKAEKLLADGKDKFPASSNEDKQIEELLAKVKAELGSGDQNVKEVSLDANNILVLEKANSSATGFSQNSEHVYFITTDSIFSVNKKSGKKSEIIKNDNYWKSAAAIAPFQTNLYVLDLKNGVLKFVPSGSDYDKSDYLKSVADLTKSKAMAIDSAVWIIQSDGNIKKYLRGEEENFTIKNLDKPLTNPTKIFTDPDTDNLYVLDNGNSRVVALGKDGTFQKQYTAGIIANAKDFEVLEKDKKVNILSNDKIYQLNLD